MALTADGMVSSRSPRRAAPALASVECFTGGGGLALGVARAGYGHLLVVESSRAACETLRANLAGDGESPDGDRWPLWEGDIRTLDWSPYGGRVDLLAAGAPCQPFSWGGSRRGQEDGRNLFPEVVRALRELRPRAFLIENVRGITLAPFAPYFNYVLAQLRIPTLRPKRNEAWTDHKRRLDRASIAYRDPTDVYAVWYKVMDAADYGLPQIRHRVIMVGFRLDLGLAWAWPEPSHSRDALIWAQAHGDYWREHGLPGQPPPTPRPWPRLIARIERGERPPQSRWRTLRDALMRLPEPHDGKECPVVANHVGIPGARLYHGHTGSLLDWPAKTVKAGAHGPPGGEHVLLHSDGGFRYLTVRECARLQGFPDDYRFQGSRKAAMGQIGNAVPVPLAELMAGAIAWRLRGTLAVAHGDS